MSTFVWIISVWIASSVGFGAGWIARNYFQRANSDLHEMDME